VRNGTAQSVVMLALLLALVTAGTARDK
jgi:hypothetical protein